MASRSPAAVREKPFLRRSIARFTSSVVILGSWLVFARPAPADSLGTWQSTGTHLSAPGEIIDMEFYQGDLFAIGDFPRLSPDGACYLARYDGVQWTAVDGMAQCRWRRMRVFNGLLYLNCFAGELYSYDGSIGTLIFTDAELGTVWQDQLVVYSRGPDQLRLFDGSQWSQIAVGLVGSVRQAFSGGGELFLEVKTQSGNPCEFGHDEYAIYILEQGMWVQTDWSTDRPLTATAGWQGKAWVSTGGVTWWFDPFRRVAHFDDGGWVYDIDSPGGLNPAGVPTQGATSGLFELDDRLLIEVGSTLIEFDGSAFQTLAQIEGGDVGEIVPDGTDFYVGGDFRAIAGTIANGFAFHSQNAWSSPSFSGTGLESAVSALGWFDDEVVVATTPLDDYGVSQVFTSTLASEDALAQDARAARDCYVTDVGGCQTLEIIECRDLGAVIRGLVDFDGALFALGEILDVDGVETGAVAQWDRVSWSPVDHDEQTSGPFVPEQLFGLREVDGTLWMAGYDTTPMIQQFDGSRFNDVSTLRLALDALGPGCDYYRRYLPWPFGEEVTIEYGGPTVFDLVGFGGELVLGTDAGLVSWDGSTLDILDQGWLDTAPPECCIPFEPAEFVCPQVRALAVDEGVLYAGGWFGTASDATRNIVKYEDGQWLPLETGLDGRVNALVARNGYLIAGGSFTYAGVLEVNGIALWDGAEWHALDGGIGDAFGGITMLPSGPTAEVQSLLLDDCGHVFVGGAFVEAGGQASSNLAIWSAPSILSSSDCSSTGTTPMPSKLRLSAAPNPFNPATEIRFDLPRRSEVRLEFFDLAGRRVRTIELGLRSAGNHTTIWRGTDDGGRHVASGVYVVRLTAGAQTRSLRVVLLR